MREARVERELLSTPLYRALSEVDGKTYEAAVGLVKEGVRNGRTQSEVIGQVQQLLNGQLTRYIGLAADGAVVRYYGTVVRRFEDLHTENPWLCHNLIIGKNTADLTRYLSSDTQNATMAAMEELVRTAAERVEPRASDKAQVEKDLATAIQSVIGSEEDLRTLEDPTGRGVDPGRSCELNIQLYRAVLRLPDNRAGTALRFLTQP